MKYLKRNFAPGRSYRDLDDFNAQLMDWLIRVADVRLHGTTHQRPIDRFADEAGALVATASQASFLQAMVRDCIVAEDWLVSIDGNRYSVPFDFIGRTVQVVREGGHWVIRHRGPGSERVRATCPPVAPPGGRMNTTTLSAATGAAQLERLGEHLKKLRLRKSAERLEALLQHAAAQELPYADFLEQVLGEEVAAKRSQNIAMRTAMARFPFLEHGDNILVLGPPGVGKSHLAVSLGLKAIEAGYRVLFTTAAHLIASLTKAHAEGKLDDKLKVYTAPRLLIIDEIGYLPIERQGANLFFQLISRRYERGPMILTSNQSFSAWGDVFGDRVIATAILDRLLHHAVTLNIRGNSYRLKEKLKAGLIRSTSDDNSQPGGEI